MLFKETLQRAMGTSGYLRFLTLITEGNFRVHQGASEQKNTQSGAVGTQHCAPVGWSQEYLGFFAGGICPPVKRRLHPQENSNGPATGRKAKAHFIAKGPLHR